MSEPRDIRLRRLKMRSMRRGIREMDLILSDYADNRLDALDDDGLALYDQLLGENDQDLYAWVTGRENAPDHFSGLVKNISQVFQKKK